MVRRLTYFFSMALMCLCVFITSLQINAIEVSSTAISLDLAAGSVEIYESEGITYCVQNGENQATTGGVIIRQTNSGAATANTVTVASGGCKVTIAGVNIEGKYPIWVKNASVLELTLVGNNDIKATSGAGICVPAGTTLELKGSGTLNVSGHSDAPGIGAIDMSRNDAGSIVISGGTIIAKNEAGQSGSNAPGIGGAYGGHGGTITITGGTVTSIGGVSQYPADIGGGFGSTGGAVIITGGVVIADEIGAGYRGTFDSVTIDDAALVTNADGNKTYVDETIFIDIQPLSSAAYLNNTPRTYVVAHGHSGLSYQWQVSIDNKNWIDLEGETTAEIDTFVITEATDGAYLRCKLVNGWGNVEYTDTVQIYVLAYAKQPTSVDANLNDMVAFEALSCCSNVTYQWQRSYDEGATWNNVPGETFSTLIVNATLSECSAQYRCVITATNGDWLASDVVSVNLDLGELVTYTVQDFLQNPSGSGYTLPGQQVLEGLSGTTVTAPEGDYDGFTLNTRKSTLSGTVAEDSSLVLTRYFDRNTYSITFDTNGGSALPDLDALYGASITAPSIPTRYGCVFDGWYADEGFTEEYTFDTMPLNGATIYAKWVPVGADRGIEYKINGLAIRDSATFELLDEISVGRFLVEVSVTNLEATETDTILLVQYTAAGQMLSMQYLYANAAIGQTVTFGASVDNSNGNIGIIKAFVLPSLGNPVPLAEAESIGK